MALQQHFSNARGIAKIAVNAVDGLIGIRLSHLVGIEQVRVGAFGHEDFGFCMRQIRLPQACREVHEPGATPADIAVAINVIYAAQERLFDRFRQFGIVVHGDLIAGMHGIEMRNMPMPGPRVFIVFRPFLQLSVLAHPVRFNPGQGFLALLAELFVDPQNRTGLNTVRKHLPAHGQREGGPNRILPLLSILLEIGSFRRKIGERYQVPGLRVFGQIIQIEERRLLDKRIGARSQELLIEREQVMLPVMLGKPARSSGETHPSLQPGPDILRARHAVGREARNHHAPGAIVVFCHPLGPFDIRIKHIEKGLEQLRHIAHVGSPVVHLLIHIIGVSAKPLRKQVRTPVDVAGREEPFPRRRNQQIPSKLEMQRIDLGVAVGSAQVELIVQRLKPYIGGQCCRARRAQRQVDPLEYLLIISQVRLE